MQSIQLFGTTDNYNTEATERQHIDQAKHAFAASNKRDFIDQMCSWLERREAVFWFATHLAWKAGTIFTSNLQKPCKVPRATVRRDAVQLAVRPNRLHVTLQQLDIDFCIPNFKAVLRSFLRKWHHIRVHRGYEPKLPHEVETALKILGSVQTWNLAKFRTPNLQTFAAPDLVNKVYASPAAGRFDSVLVQTKGHEEAGATGLDGVWPPQVKIISTHGIKLRHSDCTTTCHLCSSNTVGGCPLREECTRAAGGCRMVQRTRKAAQQGKRHVSRHS